MTDDRRTTGQPPLADLLARYLSGQSAAHTTGLAAVVPADVEPYEAVPVQAVDPRQAWDEATAALARFGGTKAGKASRDWPQLVAAQPSQTGLAFAAGNFPQLVRDLAPLYRAESLAALPVPEGEPVAFAAGDDGSFPQALMTLGLLRLARQWDAVDALMRKHADRVPAEWADAWDNEEAALLWHRGRRDEAARRWQALPESVPVLFNRGMAALFLDRPAEARADLRKATEMLPESSGWHHLGRLYLALAGG